jgi:hypothetical protein
MTSKRLLLFFLFVTTFAQAQFPEGVNTIEPAPNQITTFEGNLSNGKKIEDLSWAEKSSVACFPGTQNAKFRGNHVLHGFVIPAYSEVTVTVEPKDKQADFSLYGYQVGTTNYSVVPNLSSCVSCEADHKWDYNKKNQTQDHTRSIKFNAIGNSYNIFIGVTGNNGLSEGDYTLSINLKTREQSTSSQEKVKIYSAASQKGATKAYKGDLASGVKIQDLSWAENSAVACFPATQNTKFRGNHILYVTEIPANSKMYITLIPDDKNANMSLYAYMTGTNSDAVVPNLSSCVTCEADHKWDYPKKGKTQDHTRSVYLNSTSNSYRVVIGVAGADALDKGTFVVQIKID